MATKTKKPPPDPPPLSPAPDLSYIAEALRPLAVPCDTIDVDPNNLRKHDDPNLSALRGSLKTYGQLKIIVVNKATKKVEAGNGTLPHYGIPFPCSAFSQTAPSYFRANLTS